MIKLYIKKKQVHKPSKIKQLIKNKRIKFDKQKKSIGDKLKTILDFINYFKYKKKCIKENMDEFLRLTNPKS